jgi:hypothetical protein
MSPDDIMTGMGPRTSPGANAVGDPVEYRGGEIGQVQARGRTFSPALCCVLQAASRGVARGSAWACMPAAKVHPESSGGLRQPLVTGRPSRAAPTAYDYWDTGACFGMVSLVYCGAYAPVRMVCDPTPSAHHHSATIGSWAIRCC